jgi:hypothetical protein
MEAQSTHYLPSHTIKKQGSQDLDLCIFYFKVDAPLVSLPHSVPIQ